MANLKKTNGSGEPPKGKPTANIQKDSKGNPTSKKGIDPYSSINLVYEKNPEGKVTNTVQDLYGGYRGTKPKADSYKIRHKDEALGRTSGYLVKESKAYTLPSKEIKSNISKPSTLPSRTPTPKATIASKIKAALSRAKKG